jgi:hypothetical protein
MASDRVSKEVSELCPIPSHTWYWKPASVILERPIIKSNLDMVALNEPLMENLKKESIKNPFLCLSNWWPLVGSQRLRAIREIRETDKDYDPLLQLAVFDKPYENVWRLWSDEEFRSKASAIQYQLWELVFKSQWYYVSSTEDGTDMRYYETLGDQLTGWSEVTTPSGT